MKIFLIHKGRHVYLKYVLKELVKHNNQSDIVLLTDDKKLSKEYFGYNIIYENISDYFIQSEKFGEIYVHKSKNPFIYELICFQRWLVILEYMEKHNIESCRHIDSDVLVFCNLEDYANKYLEDYNFCCVGPSGGTFYGNKKGLTEFKNFLFDAYKHKLDILESYYKEEWACVYERNNGYVDHEQTGCVSDMTLFYLFLKEHIKGVKYKDIGMINNNSAFDDNINRGVGFNHNGYIKSFKLINGNYYGSLQGKNKEKILFNCIHFAGNTKELVKFFEEKNLGLKYYITLYYTKLFVPSIVKISNKIGITNILMKIYHRIKSIIYGESLPLR